MTAKRAFFHDRIELIGVIVLMALLAMFRSGPLGLDQTLTAEAAACPITDGGVGDDDATTNGTVTVSSSKTFTAITGTYDCTATPFVITGTGTLTLAGNGPTGQIAQVNFGTLTVDIGGKITADAQGCANLQPYYGYVPTSSNVCTYQGQAYAGYGPGGNTGGAGGGHGGAGGLGTSSTETGKFGNPNDSATAPVLFGASGGSANGVANTGGTGGGVVRISVSGTFTNNGIVSANGANGAVVSGGAAGGGGAGGSINVTASTLNGTTGTFEAKGGNGADNTGDGGGGGGGRIAILTGGGTFAFDAADFVVTGGTATGVAGAGAKGTVYVKNTASNAVSIFHGFTYDNTKHFASSWTIDPSATNQYCDPTISGSPEVHTTGAISFDGTLTCAPGNPGTGAYNLGTGTISSSGTTVTGSGTSFLGQVYVGDSIIANGQTRFITSIASSTSLTVDGAFSPALASGTIFVYSTNSNSASTFAFDAATTLTIASNSSMKTKSAIFLNAGSTFTVGTGVAVSATKVNANLEFNVPTGSSQTWDSLTVNVGAEGEFIIDDAIGLTLQNGTAVNASVRWTALTSLTQNSTTSINANGKGCVNLQQYWGYVPDGSNNCVYDGTGATSYGASGNTGGGGGGHGGYGGPGTSSTSPERIGGTNDSATNPLRFGASGGGANNLVQSGGTGGGLIRINVSGTYAHNGTLTANGNSGFVVSGGAAGGGGAGGSINVTAGTLNGTTGTYSAVGGNGADNTGDGGGGGGGRVAVVHGGGTYAFDAGDFVVDGGSVTGTAVAGNKGTVYVKNTATDAVAIYHGFTYDNTNHFATTWTIDPSATNQYCDTTISGGPAVHTTGALSFAGSLICAVGNPGTGAYSAGSGTISSSGTAITGSGTNFTGQFFVGDAIIVRGQTKFVTSITSTTSMTVDSAFSPDIPAGTAFLFSSTSNSVSSLTFDAATSLTVANGSVIKTKSALNLSAGSSFSIGTGVAISTTKANADFTLDVPAGSSQAWDSLIVHVGPEGELIADDAFGLTLQNGTAINANVRWTALTSFTQNAGTAINANAKGCVNLQPYFGYVPNSANNCIYNDSGAAPYGTGSNTAGGGGGHGGFGGPGTASTAAGDVGGTNDSATNPLRFGSSGGSANGVAYSGGTGGGLIRIVVSGTFTHNGTLTANGNNGQLLSGGAAGGGGAGGSINIVAGTLNGTSGTFSATGGNGADNTADGGGGGGGRVAVLAGGGSYSFDASDFAVTGGSATGTGVGGEKGTVYVKNSATEAVTVYHGFTYDNTSHFASSWTVDPSTTNQYCDITITGSPAVHTTGAIALDGTLRCAPGAPGTGEYTVGSGTISSVGTTVTGSGSNFTGQFFVGDIIVAGGVTRFVTAIASATSMTVDSAFPSDLPSGTGYFYGTSSITSLTFNAGTTLTVANGSVLKAKGALSLGAGSTFTIGTGVALSTTKINADLEFNVPPGSSQTWDSLTVHVGPEGEFITDDAFGLTLQNGTAINANVRWTALTSLTQNSGTSLNANSKGCVNLSSNWGYVPNSSNNCIYNGTGAAGYGASSNTGGAGGGHGGAGGLGTSTSGSAGTANDSSTAPVLFGASGGSSTFLNYSGGIGGGLIRISVSGTYAHDGSVSANAGNGVVASNGGAGGGGAGGSIYVTAATYNCSTGTFSAAGGNGADNTGDGGGGGGGRFSVEYGTDASGGCPLSGLTAAGVAPGGTATGSAVAGSTGTLNLTNPVPTPGACPWTDNDANDNDATVGTYEFSVAGSPYAVAASSATYDCSGISLFKIVSGVTVNLNSNTSTGAVAALKFNALTVGSGGVISADGRGCPGQADHSRYPDGSNICNIDVATYSTGAGGAGHGGYGGTGSVYEGGAIGYTYGSATNPYQFGASGGTRFNAPSGAAGGGVVKLTMTGTLTLDGTISANGNNGATSGSTAGGGGAGGSINISAATINGSTGLLQAKGGNGGDSTNDGGGGGGGRIAVTYNATGSSYAFTSSNLDVSGGTASGSVAVAGAKGTVYVNDDNGTKTTAIDDDVRVFHGFTFTDSDLYVNSWIDDSSATNQYCDLGMGTGATPSVTAATVSRDGTLICANGIPSVGTGTISSSGTTVTGTGGNFYSLFSVGDLIIAAGQTRFITAINSNTSLTVDQAFSPSLSAGTVFRYTTTSITSLAFTATSGFSLGAGSSIKTKGAMYLSGGTSFSVGAGANLSVTKLNSDLELNVPAGNNQAWSGLTVHTSREGDFIVDDAIAITLSSGASLNGNVRFTNLTAFTQDSGTSINADGKGCNGQPDYTRYPDGSNNCTIDLNTYSVGAAAAGHGGLGGAGSVNEGGATGYTYGSATFPVLYGGSGGSRSNNPTGANGGGLVRISASGAIALNGSISANGNHGAISGTTAGAGGAGGSINIMAGGALSGSITSFSAKGGNGGDSTNDGGGGGGGRIALSYGSTSVSLASSLFDVSGGTATGTAIVGQKGTVYAVETAGTANSTGDDVVRIYHGFTYVDSDVTVAQWNIDSSATNQYCNSGIGSATPSVSTTSAITFDGELNCTTATAVGTGTISSSGVTVTGSGTNFQGQLAVGTAIIAGGQTRFVTAIASNTSLTVDSAFSPALSGVIFTYNTASISSFVWSSASAFTSAANSTMRVNGAVAASAPTLTIGNAGRMVTRGSLSLSASSDFVMGTGVTVTDVGINTDIDFNIPAGDNQTWSGLTLTTPTEGDFTVDDAIAITFSSGTAVNGNVRFTNLTTFTQDVGTSINADGRGCAGTVNYGSNPNGSNVCNPSGVSTYGIGAGGGSHAGLGGNGTSQADYPNTTYGSATAPVLYGTSGGGTNTGIVNGSNGGGVVRINASGTITLNGTVSANGNDAVTSGANAAGGGAGGSIFISTIGSLTGSIAALTADGGDGAVSTQKGGGGGGGRIALTYGSTTFSLAAGFFDVSGGSATSAATVGQTGTVYANQVGTNLYANNDDAVRVYHGFTYTDFDWAVASWTVDPGAVQDCDPTMGTGATPSVTATGAISFDGELNCTTSTTLGTGTISSSGTTVTGSGTNFTGQFGIGTAIIASGQTRFVTAIASATSLTIDTPFSPVLSGVIFRYNTSSISSFAWQAGTTFGYAAGSKMRVNGAVFTTAPTLTVGNNAILTTRGTLSQSASTDFSMGTGVTVTNTATNTDIDFNMPVGDDQSWSGLTVNAPAEGDFTVDDAIAITLTASTAISGNVRFTNLTSFTQDAGTSINANGKGCAGTVNYGISPNGSNGCVNLVSTYGIGAGGGSHGGRGGNGTSQQDVTNTTYGSSTAPLLYGTSGGGTNTGVINGGNGGGLVRISASGTITLGGTVTADGYGGVLHGTNASAGGAGGSIYISTSGSLTGSIASFSAKGGDGAASTQKGGGGGGGRIALAYGSTTFPLAAGFFNVDGGAATAAATAGTKGTVYVDDTVNTVGMTDDIIRIYHGFTFADVDHSVAQWIIDASATNQYCDTSLGGGATPSVTTTSALTFRGTMNCNTGSTISSFTWTPTGGFTAESGTSMTVRGSLIINPPVGGITVNDTATVSSNVSGTAGGNLTLTSPSTLVVGNSAIIKSYGAMLLSATTTFTLGSSVAITNDLKDTNIDFNIPAGNDQTWSGLTVNVPREGDLTVDDAIAITLASSTAINGNARLTNLTAFTQDAGTSINANGKGCEGGTNYSFVPNGSNSCVNIHSTYGAGAAGGSHGGRGGNGTSQQDVSNTTYGSATAPAFYGTSGGGTNTGPVNGGNGGGLIRINASGTVTLNGNVTADGTAGAVHGTAAAAGGAGGSIFITAGTLAGTPASALSAKGGDGAASTQKGGGGGGGRISLVYASNSLTIAAATFNVDGGAATSAAVAGTKGTVYVNNTVANTVQIFHGFTYADVDYSAAAWTIDTTATNQYCDTSLSSGATPSVTATSPITFNNSLSCPGQISSFTWSSPGGFTMPASTSMNVNAPLTLTTTGALSVGNSVTLTSAGAMLLSAGTTFTVGTGVTVTDSVKNTDINFNVPAGNNQTWDSLTVNVPVEGDFLMDDNVALTLQNGTAVNGNVRWTNLTDFTQNSGTSINANGEGCASGSAYGIIPDGSNNCVNIVSTYGNGAGGGSHGGAGGNGTSQAGAPNATYDSATAPVLYGTSGGSTNTGPLNGGAGGGIVRIVASGTFTHNGTIAADGTAGAVHGVNAAGGGAGGSIYVSTSTYTCSTGTFSAKGGNGADGSSHDGGGGGGGRVSISYNTDSSGVCLLSGLTAAGVVPGGTATGSATAGATGSLSLNAGNPVPAITSISPDTKNVGDAGFTLTVNGSNFVSGAVVRFNGSDRTTTFVNANQVTASILSGDVATAGLFPITVFNPAPAGGLSNAVNLTVNNPTPTTTNITPNNKNVGDGAFTMTVNGTNFVTGSVVRFAGSDRTTTYVNSTQLTASIPASDMLVGGNFDITVFNAAPGGGTSNAQTFTVGNPIPTTTSISPTTKNQGDATFTLTVNGTGFVATSVVRFAGSDRTTTYVNSTQLTASIPASDLTTAGTFNITVFSPAPGGGTSNAQTFTVGNPVPTTSSLSPSSKTAGDAGFTLTVNGTNFVSGSVVRWNGADRTTTFVNANQVTASISAGDIATGGTFTVTVFNAAPGGGTSNGQTFTVNNPVPVTSSISPTTRAAGSGNFTLTVNGSSFVSTSVVRFAGSDRTTTFVNSGQLTASIPNSDITANGTYAITVFNPTPGGGESNSQTLTVENPTPTTTSISPTSKDPGSSGFTLTVNGTNFIASSVVRFAGSDRTTTYVNSTQLTASILTSDLTTSGTFAITVFNAGPGGGTSNSQNFIVGNPVPVTSSISPNSKTLNDGAFTMTVNGSDFVTGSVVRLNGSDRTTTFVNSGQLTASIPASDMISAGTFTITVFNPAPIGGTSNGQTFTVNNPTPTTSSISPNSKNVGELGFTLTVDGTNFITSSVVRLNGSDRTTTFVNSTQVTASILTADLTTAGTFTITVFTPGPGGGTSNGQTLTVNNLAPTTATIAPTVKAPGSSTFTLTVNGNNFVSNSVVRFDGSDRTTTFVAATQLTAEIPAGDLTTPGTFTITVFTPGPGGGTSNGQIFTVGNLSNSATLSNKVTMSRLRINASSTVSIAFNLQNTLSGVLTVTFPAGFTVTAPANSGASSACLSGFGFTATTLTAVKSNCSGTVVLGGGTVTNPATPGVYYISWVNDDPGGGSVIITDSDQVEVTFSVDPIISFNVGSQTAACDGTFAGNGGALGLGTMTQAAVASSDVSSVPHVCARLSTNASSGATVTVRSANGALVSAGTPADQIVSATATLVAATAGYGLCVGSSGGDTGRDTTTPTGASPTAVAPFNGSCTTSAHSVGILTTSNQTVWSITGPSQNAFARLFVKASVSPATQAHNDYQDLLTFIATGTY